jgi:hypothetical protein
MSHQIHHDPFPDSRRLVFFDELQACRWMAMPLAPGPNAALAELILSIEGIQGNEAIGIRNHIDKK